MNLNIINAQNFQFRQNTFIARQTVTKGLRNILSSTNNNYSYSFLTWQYWTGINNIFINPAICHISPYIRKTIDSTGTRQASYYLQSPPLKHLYIVY